MEISEELAARRENEVTAATGSMAPCKVKVGAVAASLCRGVGFEVIPDNARAAT